jgi:Xaa-Pro dipeptidase
MRITPASELTARIARLQTLMQQDGLDAVLMIQNADLFYFTGSIQQGMLYVPADGEALYMVRKDFGRARMESGLKEVVPFKSPKDIAGILASYGYPQPQRAGMELDVVPVELYQRFTKGFDGCVMVNATHQIRTVRAIKSEYEIAIMKDAALQVDRVCQRAREVIREGMTDLELAAELEFCARKQGHQGVIRMRGFNNELFYAQIFSGADSAVPAFLDTPLGGLGLTPAVGQSASYKTIRRGEPVIVDFAGAFDGYLIDQTRIFSVGPLPDQLQRAYEDMLRVQHKMQLIARPGVAWGAVYDQCHQYACDLGYGEVFMGNPGAQVSFIGHGVGTEIDEYPFIARGFKEQVLEENMTFAFEPKVVYAGLGAIGIENTFRLTADGPKHLTFSPEELVVL